MTDDDIVQLKFSFPIPKGNIFAKFSLKYPLLHFNVLSTLLLNKHQANCLIQIIGVNIEKFWNDFTRFYDKNKFQLIFKDKNTLLMNILIEDPWILKTIMDGQLLVRFPLVIYDGLISIELISPRKNIQLMFKNPKWKAVNVAVKQIGQYCPDSLLSSKHTEILIHALKNGFFDVPRKKTLSALATDLELSPSALSENLRRITKKLGNQYLDCVTELQ